MKKNDKNAVNFIGSRLKGQTSLYLKMPMYFSFAALPIVIWEYTRDIKGGFILSIALSIYLIFSIVFYNLAKGKYKQELIDFATDYTQVQKKLIKGLDIPYGLLDKDGKFLWGNPVLENICKNTGVKYINSMFSDISLDSLKFEEDSEVSITYITHESVFYRVEFNKIQLNKDFTDDGVEEGTEYLVAMYMFDETEIKRLTKENNEQKMVAGLIYIDNYDDALQSVEDVRQSLLVALIDRRINKYFAAYNAIVKKIEKDKYFIAMKQKYISVLQSDKFSILDEVKAVNIGNEMAVTISIGFGVNGEEYTHSVEYSRVAIEMALGRGGDQAVVKDGERLYFYGGKSKQVEKNTRVKARVKAHALREVLETKEKIVIMGHKIGDIDSFGSAIGISRAVKSINKKAYIVINEITSSIRPMLEIFKENDEYEELFINSDEAIDIVDSNTAVVVVDVSRPSYVECPQILSRAKDVVILDHHRRSSDVIENAALSYIEPYASSASEMVAEILQYFIDGIKVKNIEAEAMYAGIMVDTNNFTKNTGVRTFEAAAFLRKHGADVTHVRQMFRDSMDDYRAKAKAISTAEVFGDVYSLAVCPSEGIDSPTVLGAQIANELLNIRGIKATFVLTEFNSKVYISARSMGDISVQLIMEKLGGGGHLDTAGAQLENASISEAKEIVKETVLKMVKEKEV
ncbi:MAG: DHH family phosphoesterase [Lachnospiraceae bacterium]|nr:DHH family phosphoesterase [Lachnospiraceae bacterium]